MDESFHIPDYDTVAKPVVRNIPWVEKYRPKKLSDVVSHADIVTTLNKFISDNKLPHLLFYGPPGTGKTSTILACARRLYSSKEFQSMVLELNASDDRGISTVRGPILSFSSTRTIFSKGCKLIILDEADAMTREAQNALRRIIEKYTDNVRFCLICNCLQRIIPAIQSRCTRFRFGPLPAADMSDCIQNVAVLENINMTSEGLATILRLSGGDMRRAMNTLQSTSLAYDTVDSAQVYACTGHVTPEDTRSIVTWLLNDTFSSGYAKVLELKSSKGLALSDIITELHLLLVKLDLPLGIKLELFDKLGGIEYNLATGCTDKIQLAGVIGAFQIARNAIIKQEL